MAYKIKAFIKRPDEEYGHSTSVSNTLENFQRNVGGYIEVVGIAPGVVVVCDEEGRLKGKPYNCTIFGIDFVGDIVVVGVDGEEFADVPISWDTWKKWIKED